MSEADTKARRRLPVLAYAPPQPRSIKSVFVVLGRILGIALVVFIGAAAGAFLGNLIAKPLYGVGAAYDVRLKDGQGSTLTHIATVTQPAFISSVLDTIPEPYRNTRLLRSGRSFSKHLRVQPACFGDERVILTVDTTDPDVAQVGLDAFVEAVERAAKADGGSSLGQIQIIRRPTIYNMPERWDSTPSDAGAIAGAAVSGLLVAWYWHRRFTRAGHAPSTAV